MLFEFATATRIIFGSGSLNQIGPLAANMGKHAFVVTGSNTERAAPLLEYLSAQEVSTTTFSVSHEPTINVIVTAVKQAKQAKCDLVIGMGGGSVMDAGKAIAALATNRNKPLDYLEVIGKGEPLLKPPLPYIAIPTTAGTGAEVTRNAVLSSPKHNVKVSLRNPLMLPQLAVVDPTLTHSMSPEVTASTGLDALTQVMEPYVSNKANPLTDLFCKEGMKRAAGSLRSVYKNGDDTLAREDMALASLLGGLALANAKLGAVHGFAGPLGGMYPDAPHGVICAKLLPFVVESNIQALQKRTPNALALSRYNEIARILTGSPRATATDVITWLKDLCEELHVPTLSTFGLTAADFPVVISKAKQASSMKGNPINLTDDELTHILHQVV